MKAIRIALFACLAAWSASPSWAQYGLYGSPETLRLPQSEATQYAGPPVAYPATATPTAQPMPTPAYYPPQPQYSYPAQPAATAAYQPYRPGTQYRSPSTYFRPPVRTAAVGQPALQPIPAPPVALPAPTDALTPAPQGSGMMNQMLAEQNGANGCGCDNGCGGAYRPAMGRFEQAACGQNAEGCGFDGGYCQWYASLSALAMGRSDGRRIWTSYNAGSLTDQLANTQFGLQWKWGGEVRFGRRFCCGCVPYAVEATYWTTEAFSGLQITTNPVSPYTLNTPLRIDYLTFGGTAATTYFNGAREHRLWRNDEFHNVEVNIIREQLAWTSDSPWDIGWSAGVRYFRFQEGLRFGSLMADHAWGESGGLYEAYLSDDVTNNLVGAQFGFDAAYNVWNGVRVFIAPKVGIYDNFMESTFRAYTGAGTAGSSVYYGAFPAHSTRTGLSFLTQVDVGADWQFTRNWSARLGYRLVAITGAALADDQFPQYIVDIPEIRNIQHCSNLILHGAFLGVTYNF